MPLPERLAIEAHANTMTLFARREADVEAAIADPDLAADVAANVASLQAIREEKAEYLASRSGE